MSELALSDSFEYLCYAYATNYVNILILLVRGQTLYRRQILTYKDGPRDKRVKLAYL